jgi:hypothetical protein
VRLLLSLHVEFITKKLLLVDLTALGAPLPNSSALMYSIGFLLFLLTDKLWLFAVRQDS